MLVGGADVDSVEAWAFQLQWGGLSLAVPELSLCSGLVLDLRGQFLRAVARFKPAEAGKNNYNHYNNTYLASQGRRQA